MTYEQFITLNPTPDAPTQMLVAKAWKAATDRAKECVREAFTDYCKMSVEEFAEKYNLDRYDEEIDKAILFLIDRDGDDA
jgi:hypothetical protein